MAHIEGKKFPSSLRLDRCVVVAAELGYYAALGCKTDLVAGRQDWAVDGGNPSKELHQCHYQRPLDMAISSFISLNAIKGSGFWAFTLGLGGF